MLGIVSYHKAIPSPNLTHPILLNIFTTVNNADMNIFAAEHLLLLPYDEFS